MHFLECSWKFMNTIESEIQVKKCDGVHISEVLLHLIQHAAFSPNFHADSWTFSCGCGQKVACMWKWMKPNELKYLLHCPTRLEDMTEIAKTKNHPYFCRTEKKTNKSTKLHWVWLGSVHYLSDTGGGWIFLGLRKIVRQGNEEKKFLIRGSGHCLSTWEVRKKLCSRKSGPRPPPRWLMVDPLLQPTSRKR